jgi:uncharacterized membrane protein
MRHRWVVLLAACAMVLMAPAAHAFNETSWQGMGEGLVFLAVSVLVAAAVVGALVVLIIWAICAAIGRAIRGAGRSQAEAESQQAEAQMEDRVTGLQRRLADAESELAQYRAAPAPVARPAPGPARADGGPDQVCPSCGKRNRGNRSFCWSCSADLPAPAEGGAGAERSDDLPPRR